MTREELSMLYHLAVADMLQGKHAAADTKFDQYMKTLDGVEPSNLEELLSVYVHKLHLHTEDRVASSNLAIHLLQTFEDTKLEAEALQSLAQFHHTRGELEQQIQLLTKLINKFPKGITEPLLDLGLAYVSLKKVREAVVYLNKYLNTKGVKNKQIAAIKLAECYNALHSPTEAQAILERYMK